MYNRIQVDPMERLKNKSPEIASILANTLKKRETAFNDRLAQREIRKSMGLSQVKEDNLLTIPKGQSISEFRKKLNKGIMTMATPEPEAMAKSIAIDKLRNNLSGSSYVTVNLISGLGNWVFKILAVLGYAEKYGKKFVITKNNISNGTKAHENGLLEKIVRIFPNIPIINSLTNLSFVPEKKQFNYSPLESHNSNVILNGYFQDERYFPSDNLIPSIKTSYYPNTYFVHIRGGDYIGNSEFYISLVQYYKNCFALLDSSVKYIVFSNDNTYADTYMKQFDVSYIISDKEDQVDTLIEMANCAGGICANSTFSWLGGLFQGETRGQIFMPSIWMKRKDCQGIYPSWATIINCNKLDTSIKYPNISGSVTVNLSGGLGNRIFQIFAGLVYARKYGKKFVLCKSLYKKPEKPHEGNTDTLIETIFPDIEYVESFNSYSTAKEKSHMDYNELLYYPGNVLLNGYFQVEQYSLELQSIPNIRTDYYENTYFIHIRLGDYIGFFGMDFDLSNYHRKCFNILGPNAKYLVFSNDNENAKKYIDKFNIQYIISDKTDALEALIEMANCAGGICANSTFSWMGAFFQRQPRKNIFVPAKWVTKKVEGIFPSWAARIAL